jgi:hypothetical protein
MKSSGTKGRTAKSSSPAKRKSTPKRATPKRAAAQKPPPRSGSPGAFADPGGRLAGEGKTGRHLKLTSLEELPREAVRGWLRAAASLARGG